MQQGESHPDFGSVLVLKFTCPIYISGAMQKTATIALNLACVAWLRSLQVTGSAPSLQPLAWAYEARAEANAAGISHPLRAIGTLLLAGRPSAAFYSAASPWWPALRKQAGLRHASTEMRTGIKMVPRFSIKANFEKLRKTELKFIAADPGLMNGDASEGGGATKWGIWESDPGQSALELSRLADLEAHEGSPPVDWKFDPEDWWLEEYGRLMPSPTIPIPNGKYLLPWLNGKNSGRPVILTIEGDRWFLDKRSGASLKHVTHLPCRSARYSRVAKDASPSAARSDDFPVRPGCKMPSIDGYEQVDYAVLFVEGLGRNNSSPSVPRRATRTRAKGKEKALVPN